MKNIRSFSVSVLIAGSILTGFPALADLEVTTSVQVHARVDFEAPLASHGTWVEFGSYGRCWRPGHVVVGWRPYCSGEWVWTDCGWYWASDEPWAWACYHYGSWVFDPTLGWVWVPGVEWAPAWVSWRVGGGYIGWAPLPPPGVVFAAQPKSEHFVFVGEARFGGPVTPGIVVVNSASFIKRTTVIGGVEKTSRSFGGPSQKVFVNTGPSLDRIQKATGKSIAAVSIHEASKRTPLPSKNVKMVADNRSSGGKKSEPAESDHGLGQDRSKQDRDSWSGRDWGDRAARAGNSGGGGHGKH